MDKPMMCFWCKKELYKRTRTRDHLISRPLRHATSGRYIHEVRLACEPCNHQRGKISDAYRLIVKKKKWCAVRRRKTIKKLLKNVDIDRFKTPILEADDVPVLVKEACLSEIDTVLKFRSCDNENC